MSHVNAGRARRADAADQVLHGLSDWDAQDFGLEARIGDVKAVVDDMGVRRFALMGMAQGGGADVVACDLTPELLETGRLHAATAGVELRWEVADAEALPYGDGQFDTVLSCVGVMFAPHHQASTDELVRVLRVGGTLGLISWTPAGFIGQLFATMKPYAAPPPPGAQPPPLWGDEAHVRELLGDRVTDVAARTQGLRVTQLSSPTAFREFFATNYGPTIAAYRGIADDPERTAALDSDLDALVARFGDDDGVLEWEYLLLTARRRLTRFRPATGSRSCLAWG